MTEELNRERDQLVMMASAFNVTSMESYSMAGDLLRDMKELAKKIEEAFNPTVEAAHLAHKTAIKSRDTYLKPVTNAMGMVRGKMSYWITEENRKREEEEKKLEAENKSSGISVAVKIEAPKVDGISTRKQWLFTVRDPKLVPEAYWVRSIDEAKIKKEVEEKKDKAEIPGVEVYSKEVVIAR